MATINVLDATSATVAIEKPLAPGQATMANSKPIVIASDQSPVKTSAATVTFVASSGNNTSTPLASGASFVGSVESILAYPNISVLAFADQSFSVTVQQYIDAGGTQLAQQNTYASVGNRLSVAPIANGNYAKITLTNTSASAMTTLVLDTQFGWIQPQDSYGNIPITLPNDVAVGAAASVAAINTDLLTGIVSGWYDAAAFHSCAIQIVAGAGISAGAIFFEQTNDTTAAAAGNVWAVEEDTSLTPTPNIAAITIAASTTRMFRAPVVARYVRVRVSTGFVGGNVQAIGVFSELPYSRMVQTVAQATAANLNATVTATNLSCNVAQVGGTNTVNGGLAGTLAIGGAAAHSAATTTNPATVGGRVIPTTAATVDATLAAGDASHLPITTGYSVAMKQYGTAELDWSAIASFTPTVWASAATLTNLRAASGTANVRTYITALQVSTDALGAADTLWVLDGPVSVTSATVATPGVFTNSGTNDFKAGDAVVFQGISGLTIPGVSANQAVYVTSTSLAATTFTVALTPGGTGVQVTVTGTATVYRVLHQQRLQTTALPITNLRFPNPLRTAPNVALSTIANATTTGTIYLTAQGYYGF